MSVVNFLFNELQKYPSEDVIFEFYDGISVYKISRGEFICDVKKAGAWIWEKYEGLGGRNVGIISQTSYQAIIWIFGTILAGSVVVPLNPEKSGEELADEIERADLSILLCDKLYYDEIYNINADIIEKIDIYRNIGNTRQFIEVKNSGPAMILFTSGTTGKSKGVILSHDNLLYSMRVYGDFYKNTIQSNYKEKFFFCLPLYHIGGIVLLFGWIFTGNEVVLCNQMKYMLRDMRQIPCEYTMMVPMALRVLANQFKGKKESGLERIKCVSYAAASIDKDTLEIFNQNKVAVSALYGLTETSAVGTINPYCRAERLLSVGKVPHGSVSIEIREGEVCLKGPFIMAGYYKDPESTKKMLDEDGWFHTGDLGYLDKEGYLFLTGRKKNLLILSNGENVSAEEVENYLKRNHDILECKVCERNDKISAEIYCDEDKKESIKNYIRELNHSLAFYKWIREVRFRDIPFSYTSTGKLKRYNRGE